MGNGIHSTCEVSMFSAKRNRRGLCMVCRYVWLFFLVLGSFVLPFLEYGFGCVWKRKKELADLSSINPFLLLPCSTWLSSSAAPPQFTITLKSPMPLLHLCPVMACPRPLLSGEYFASLFSDRLEMIHSEQSLLSSFFTPLT